MGVPDLNKGALAPVSDEVELLDLGVSGDLPKALNGTLLRNGPNPLAGRFEGTDVLAWWPEAAMLHGIELCNGRATAYRNRWVRTKNWSDYHAPARGEYLDTNPNVNVLAHGGEILALAEGGLPCVIDSELNTLGATRLHPGLAGGATAHPKVDARTGELMTFRADWSEPFLRYLVTDATGATTLDVPVEVPEPAMMHDFAITETHSIFLDLGVAYDFSLLSKGHRIPICWKEERRSRLGVIPRHGGEVTWLEIEPCFIQHVVNAYDDTDGSIVLDVARYPWYLKVEGDGFAPNPLACLWRYVINPQRTEVAEQQLDAANIELPRINETFTGYRHRYAYAVEQPTDEEMRGIVCYDFQDRKLTRFTVDAGDQNSEPVFVANPDGPLENSGWILFWVYRHATDTSDLLVLDPTDPAAGPCATVSLPRRVPAGFHGAWIPA